MLVLSQKVNGRITLHQECNGGFCALGTILIKGVRGNRVSVGLELRKDVRVIRDDAKDKQGKELAT